MAGVDDLFIRSLLDHGHPFDVPEDSRRYRLLDMVMLEMMEHYGDELKPIFEQMFARNPIERIFRFLDEEGTPLENLQMIATLPPLRFLQAALQWQCTHNAPLPPFAGLLQPAEGAAAPDLADDGDRESLEVALRMF